MLASSNPSNKIQTDLDSDKTFMTSFRMSVSFIHSKALQVVFPIKNWNKLISVLLKKFRSFIWNTQSASYNRSSLTIRWSSSFMSVDFPTPAWPSTPITFPFSYKHFCFDFSVRARWYSKVLKMCLRDLLKKSSGAIFDRVFMFLLMISFLVCKWAISSESLFCWY